MKSNNEVVKYLEQEIKENYNAADYLKGKDNKLCLMMESKELLDSIDEIGKLENPENQLKDLIYALQNKEHLEYVTWEDTDLKKRVIAECKIKMKKQIARLGRMI